MAFGLKLIKQTECEISVIYKIKVASKSSNLKGFLIYDKKEKSLVLDKYQSCFYFSTLDLDVIKKSILEFSNQKVLFPGIYYLLYKDKLDSLYLQKQKEDLEKVMYKLNYCPVNSSKDIHKVRFDDVYFMYYKNSQSILMSINENKHKVFFNYIELIEKFFKQFKDNNFPSDFFINMPD